MPGVNPGSWSGSGGVMVDLMVAPYESNTTRPGARAAQPPGHDRSVARITPGLEPALVDHAPLDIGALDGQDERHFLLEVAGPAALISAKAIKIGERYKDAQEGRRDRTRAKDALDVFRLLQVVEVDELAAGFALHARDEHAHDVSKAALSFLRVHGTDSRQLMPQLAAGEMLGEEWVADTFASLVWAYARGCCHARELRPGPFLAAID